MPAKVQWTGLRELIQELTNAPEDIRRDGLVIVHDEVEGGAAEIRAAYPDGPTGKMKRGVKVEFPSSTILVGVIKSTSPESHLYEFGTQVRRTARGAFRGSVRPHPVTVPIAKRRRRQMFERLKQMLRAKGFQVTDG